MVADGERCPHARGNAPCNPTLSAVFAILIGMTEVIAEKFHLKKWKISNDKIPNKLPLSQISERQWRQLNALDIVLRITQEIIPRVVPLSPLSLLSCGRIKN
jgi:hypothetical protein